MWLKIILTIIILPISLLLLYYRITSVLYEQFIVFDKIIISPRKIGSIDRFDLKLLKQNKKLDTFFRFYSARVNLFRNDKRPTQ